MPDVKLRGQPNVQRFEVYHEFSPKLGNITDIFVGLQTSADDVFIMDFVSEDKETICLYSKSLKQNWFFERDLVFPLVSGTDVNRYSPLPSRQYILFPYKVKEENAELIDFQIISKNQPKRAQYLVRNKKRLDDREGGKFKGPGWYRFGRNQNVGIQERIKLCAPRLVDRLYAGFDVEGSHYLDNVDVGGITLKPAYVDQTLMYILGLLNCKLLRWYFPSVSAPFRGGWLSANRQFLSLLPIRTINFSDPADKARHDKMVSLVERMLELHERNPRLPQEQEMLKREIESTDRQIDNLVYELYGLSPDEINIVEGNK